MDCKPCLIRLNLHGLCSDGLDILAAKGDIQTWVLHANFFFNDITNAIYFQKKVTYINK